jgi:hypothetical protein
MERWQTKRKSSKSKEQVPIREGNQVFTMYSLHMRYSVTRKLKRNSIINPSTPLCCIIQHKEIDKLSQFFIV